MKAADELAKHVGVKPACAALEVSRSTLYRRRGPSTGQQQPRPTPARALSETERGEVFDTLCSERFVDRSPAEVVATLLDEEVYLCSERTMYRVLASEVPVQERRAQRTHPEYKKPELMATAPNQVWSWDITRLLGPKKWSYYYLYIIMDIYSRYVVGWMVADRENSALAGRLVSAFVCQMGARISSTSALVTSETGIFPMRGKAYRSKVKIQSRPCARLRQPACFCSTTRAVASAKLGTPCLRRFSASGSPPSRASLRLASAFSRASARETSATLPSPSSRRRPRMSRR